MNDGRRRRSAKQARRDARRAKARDQINRDEYPLADIIRKPLARSHPFHLLALTSYMIHTATPDRFAFAKSGKEDSLRLESIVTGLINNRHRETTALLAVLAELLVDDEGLRQRCRREVATREDRLPAWITGLAHVEVYRAVRRTHILGDGDELMVGVRFAGGRELTLAVYLDHNMFSVVKDIAFALDSIGATLCAAVERNNDPDITVVEMSLADARAWIEYGLGWATRLPQSDSLLEGLPLLTWLIGHLPEGGQRYQSPAWDWERTSELFDKFFASPGGAPFRGFDQREMLEFFVETGTEDPLRWSVARVEQALSSPPTSIGHLALEMALGAPDLLRAFIPFAHAQSGIRDGLTAEALAAVDRVALDFRREVLREERGWGDYDQYA